VTHGKRDDGLIQVDIPIINTGQGWAVCGTGDQRMAEMGNYRRFSVRFSSISQTAKRCSKHYHLRVWETQIEIFISILKS
jgi:hypothetical protein